MEIITPIYRQYPHTIRFTLDFLKNRVHGDRELPESWGKYTQVNESSS